MTHQDPEPAIRRMIELIGRVPDELLGAPTPCGDFTLAGLLQHVRAVAINYTAAAGAATDDVPMMETDLLDPAWREQIPRDLRILARAWGEPGAWTGTGTRADGARMPRERAGLITLDEMVIHGWDVARSIGADYSCPDAEATAILGFFATFAGSGGTVDRTGVFGPVVDVPDDARLLDRALGLSGRDAAWVSPVRSSATRPDRGPAEG